MLFRRIIITYLLLFSVFSYSQEKFTLSGVIIDEKSNETLIGVSIIIEELKRGLALVTCFNGYLKFWQVELIILNIESFFVMGGIANYFRRIS